MAPQNPSLSEVHESIDTTLPRKGWRRILAYFGPAYLVSVGYMDPGNWATDLQGGAQFGRANVRVENTWRSFVSSEADPGMDVAARCCKYF